MAAAQAASEDADGNLDNIFGANGLNLSELYPASVVKVEAKVDEQLTALERLLKQIQENPSLAGKKGVDGPSVGAYASCLPSNRKQKPAPEPKPKPAAPPCVWMAELMRLAESEPAMVHLTSLLCAHDDLTLFLAMSAGCRVLSDRETSLLTESVRSFTPAELKRLQAACVWTHVPGVARADSANQAVSDQLLRVFGVAVRVFVHSPSGRQWPYGEAYVVARHDDFEKLASTHRLMIFGMGTLGDEARQFAESLFEWSGLSHPMTAWVPTEDATGIQKTPLRAQM